MRNLDSGPASIYWPYSGRTVHGEFWCTTLRDDEGRITGVRVDHADPRVLISAELLHSWHMYDGMRFGSITCAGPTCPVGDVVTIDGVNQRVIYRVTMPDPDDRWLEGIARPNAYIADWPD